ncbi:MAG: hypothetical protein ACKVOO_12345 [Burkholderiaceae bacterium]
MIGIGPAASAAMMQGLQSLLDNDAAAGTCELYKGTRVATAGAAADAAELLSTIYLAKPCGSVPTSGINAGALVLSTSPDAQLLRDGAPTWARFRAGDSSFAFDCDARLTGAADTGQEVVIAAAALLAGAFVRLTNASKFTAE